MKCCTRLAGAFTVKIFSFPKDYGASDRRKLDMAMVQTYSDSLIRYYPPVVIF